MTNIVVNSSNNQTDLIIDGATVTTFKGKSVSDVVKWIRSNISNVNIILSGQNKIIY